MKKVEIEKVDGGFEVVLYAGDKTPQGYPIVQKFVKNELEKVLADLRLFFENEIGGEKLDKK